MSRLAERDAGSIVANQVGHRHDARNRTGDGANVRFGMGIAARRYAKRVRIRLGLLNTMMVVDSSPRCRLDRRDAIPID
jgi:hypothetical protein